MVNQWPLLVDLGGDTILKLLWGVSRPEIQLGVGIHSEFVLDKDVHDILIKKPLYGNWMEIELQMISKECGASSIKFCPSANPIIFGI